MNTLLCLAALTLASAKNVTLKLESDDSKFDGKGIYGMHFGAGLNGVVVADKPESYPLNTTDNTVYQVVGSNFTYTLHQDFGQLIFAAGAPLANSTYVNGDYLTYHDSDSFFYACESLSYDPYGFVSNNDDSYGLAIYEDSAPSDCTNVKILVE